jgi:hypothetical protein
MATHEEAVQIVLDHFEEVKAATINPGGKTLAYLRLAEAYAWLMNPNQPHGGTSQGD